MEAEFYRILFILTPAFHPNKGGVQITTYKLGCHFASRGYKVAVFSFAQEGHDTQDQIQLVASHLSGGVSNHKNHEQLHAFIQDFRPDVVINQMPYEHAIGKTLNQSKEYLLLGCLRNTLFSVKGDLDSYINKTLPRYIRVFFDTRLGRSALLARHRRRHRSNLLKILATYDYFVMFAPPNLEELRFFVPHYDLNKVRLIPNSIPEICKLAPTKEKRLLWVGRVTRSQKRVDLILNIWKQVSQKLTDWELDIVGEGPDLDWLKHQAYLERLERIHFHGRQAPAEYYKRSKIFFMTSAFEGFPNTLIEAQSFGAVPVIFDSYPVASWIVEQGQSGFLVNPFDVDAMAQRIIELARSSESECERLANGALEGARRFHIDKVGAMWQELFEAEVPYHLPSQTSERAT